MRKKFRQGRQATTNSEFHRWKRLRNHTTYAHRLFKAHHTEINKLIWSTKVAEVHTNRFAKARAPMTKTAEAFNLPPQLHRKTPPTIKDWLASFSDAQNWHRLSAVMALSGYFEVYFTEVVALALESDPGAKLGAPRAVDGARLLKNAQSYSCADEAKEVAIGDWNKRVAVYKSFFGSVPNVLASQVAELEKLRRLRNGIGHAFGRDTTTYRDRTVVCKQPLSRLSEARLLKWLGIVDEVASGIESHLSSTHIGGFDYVCLYHHWWKGLSASRPSRGKWQLSTRRDRFKDHIGEQGLPLLPSKRYVDELIRYYQGL